MPRSREHPAWGRGRGLDNNPRMHAPGANFLSGPRGSHTASSSEEMVVLCLEVVAESLFCIGCGAQCRYQVVFDEVFAAAAD